MPWLLLPHTNCFSAGELHRGAVGLEESETAACCAVESVEECIERCRGYSKDGLPCSAVTISRRGPPFDCFRRAEVQIELCETGVDMGESFDTWLSPEQRPAYDRTVDRLEEEVEQVRSEIREALAKVF